MKKTLAIILALSMLAAIAVGCGGAEDPATPPPAADQPAPAADQPAPAADQPAPTEDTVSTTIENLVNTATKVNDTIDFKLGMVAIRNTDLFGTCIQLVERYCDAIGIEFEVVLTGTVDPGITLDAAESLCTSGADAVLLFLNDSSGLPPFVDLFERYGVYWATYFRWINDDEVREYVESSEYFVALTYEDNDQLTYHMLERMKETGITNVVIMGDTHGDGMIDHAYYLFVGEAENYGIEVLGETWGVNDASTAVNGTQNLLTSYPDAQSILILSGTNGRIDGTVSALNSMNKIGEVAIVTWTINNNILEDMRSGAVLATSEGHFVSALYAAVALVNAGIGYPLSDEPMHIFIKYILFSTWEDVDVYQKYCVNIEGRLLEPYSTTELREMCRYLNPDFDADALNQVVNDWSIENVIERVALR